MANEITAALNSTIETLTAILSALTKSDDAAHVGDRTPTPKKAERPRGALTGWNRNKPVLRAKDGDMSTLQERQAVRVKARQAQKAQDRYNAELAHTVVKVLDALTAGDGFWGVGESATQRTQRIKALQVGATLGAKIEAEYKRQKDGSFWGQISTGMKSSDPQTRAIAQMVKAYLDNHRADFWGGPTPAQPTVYEREAHKARSDAYQDAAAAALVARWRELYRQKPVL